MKISNFGYYWLDTWVLANVVQLATQEFCTHFLTRTNDPCGRQYDQMTQAARSAPANIAEGNSRHSTSKETDASHRCGTCQSCRIGKRLCELAHASGERAVVGKFGGIS
ncbi:MAG: four helix bundle protein [Bacteroidales bacterium]|nr:four helix bundle protein [Bacteroidales bacterium]